MILDARFQFDLISIRKNKLIKYLKKRHIFLNFENLKLKLMLKTKNRLNNPKILEEWLIKHTKIKVEQLMAYTRDSTGIKEMSHLEEHPILKSKEFMVQVNMVTILQYQILLKWKVGNSVIWNVILKRMIVNLQIKFCHLLLLVRVQLHLNLIDKGEFCLEKYIWVNPIIIMYYFIKIKERVVNITLKDIHFKLEKNQDPK